MGLDLRKKFDSGFSYEKFLEGAGVHKRRYIRTYATASVSDSDVKFFQRMKNLFIIVLAETWCPDISAILPVVIRAIEGAEGVRLKVCLRSAHKDLMDNYLTDGKAAMPKFIFLDEKFFPVAQWGPRPSTARQIFEEGSSKMKWGLLGKFLIFRKIDRFYKQDRGKEIISEIRGLLDGKINL